MATKSLIAAVAGLKSALVVHPVKTMAWSSVASSRRLLHSTRHSFAPVAAPASSNNPISQTMAQSTSPSGQSQDGTRHAAYLGEADSNDGFEAFKDAHGDPPPALDGSNSAYLGEADSDDGFEANREIHGQKLEAIDASQAAYLGEADSDDGFEADVEINPDKHRHKIEDASSSGLHGQSGEGDQ